MFHATRLARFLLTWREGDTVTAGLRDPRLERAIGVIYRPETERILLANLAGRWTWTSGEATDRASPDRRLLTCGETRQQ